MAAKGLEVLKPWKKLVEDIPYAPGVYCVWNSRTPLYIGSSRHLCKRLEAHTFKYAFIEHGANAITYLETGPEGGVENIGNEHMRRAIEYRLIRTHRPILNERQLRVWGKSDDWKYWNVFSWVKKW